MIPTRILWVAAFSFGASLGAQAPLTHLEPIPAYSIFLGDGDSYRKRIINNDSPLLFMLAEPSFEEPYAIVMTKKEGPTKGTFQYFLEYSIPIQSKKTHPPIKRRRINIPAPIANEIEKAWELVLLGTRYPPKPEASDQTVERLDGDTFEFYLHPDLFGQTWSPTEGLPKTLVDLGSAMVQLVLSSPKDKDRMLEQCHSIASSILQSRSTKASATKGLQSRSNQSFNRTLPLPVTSTIATRRFGSAG